MEAKLTQEYLRRLSETSASDVVLGTDVNVYYRYAEVRNLAKDLLANPGDRAAEGRLLKLVSDLKLVNA